MPNKKQVRNGSETGQKEVRNKSEAGQKQVRKRSETSQKRVRNRSDTGQKPVRNGSMRNRSETGQKQVRNGSETGQKRVRNRPETGQKAAVNTNFGLTTPSISLEGRSWPRCGQAVPHFPMPSMMIVKTVLENRKPQYRLLSWYCCRWCSRSLRASLTSVVDSAVGSKKLCIETLAFQRQFAD